MKSLPWGCERPRIWSSPHPPRSRKASPRPKPRPSRASWKRRALPQKYSSLPPHLPTQMGGDIESPQGPGSVTSNGSSRTPITPGFRALRQQKSRLQLWQPWAVPCVAASGPLPPTPCPRTAVVTFVSVARRSRPLPGPTSKGRSGGFLASLLPKGW